MQMNAIARDAILRQLHQIEENCRSPYYNERLMPQDIFDLALILEKIMECVQTEGERK